MTKRCAGLVLAVAGAAALFGAEAKKADTGLVVQKFKVLSSRDGAEAGTMTVTVRTVGPFIAVVEEAKIALKDRAVGWRSEVRCQIGVKPPARPEVKPLGASAETTIAGKPCMKGALTGWKKGANGTTWEAKAAATVVTDRAGAPADPPKKLDTPVTLGPGLVVFQAAVLPLAARLLPAPGELKDVCFVEFPDDIDELLNAKAGHRLVREAPDADGSYWIKLFAPTGSDPVLAVRYDTLDAVLTANLSDKFKLVPIPAEPPAGGTVSGPEKKG
jgi:hypothetical protein